jgi:hypothetical protein
MEQVVMTAIKGGIHYGLTPRETRTLAIAAIFHDMGHKGTPGDDDTNITTAIKYFNEYNDQTHVCTPKQATTVEELIRATRFPYVVPGEDLTLHQSILRDSDILQGHFSDDYMGKIVLPLFKEIHPPEKNITELLENQIKFINGMTFITDWAKSIHEKNKEILVSQVRDMEKKIQQK